VSYGVSANRSPRSAWDLRGIRPCTGKPAPRFGGSGARGFIDRLIPHRQSFYHSFGRIHGLLLRAGLMFYARPYCTGGTARILAPDRRVRAGDGGHRAWFPGTKGPGMGAASWRGWPGDSFSFLLWRKRRMVGGFSFGPHGQVYRSGRGRALSPVGSVGKPQYRDLICRPGRAPLSAWAGRFVSVIAALCGRRLGV